MVIHYGSYWLGLSLGIIVGWFLWRRNKTKVGTPSTSTNNARAKCTVCGKEEDRLFCRRCASLVA